MVFQTLTMPGTSVYEDTGDHEITERVREAARRQTEGQGDHLPGEKGKP